MTNWIEVTNKETNKKVGINFNNYDNLEPLGKNSVFKKAFFENMDIRVVVYNVKESYEEVKHKISMASNDYQAEQVNHKISVEPIDPETLKALKYTSNKKSGRKA